MNQQTQRRKSKNKGAAPAAGTEALPNVLGTTLTSEVEGGIVASSRNPKVEKMNQKQHSQYTMRKNGPLETICKSMNNLHTRQREDSETLIIHRYRVFAKNSKTYVDRMLVYFPADSSPAEKGIGADTPQQLQKTAAGKVVNLLKSVANVFRGLISGESDDDDDDDDEGKEAEDTKVIDGVKISFCTSLERLQENFLSK